MKGRTSYLVNDIRHLNDILTELAKQEVIGVDIESNSMYRYTPEICLLQLATEDDVFLIDVPKIGLHPDLRDLLLDSNILKVFQDMQYDLALFNFQFNFRPNKVFDISVADKLANNYEHFRGLEKIISQYLSSKVSLQKSQQKSNWCQRPLTDAQLSYASADVAFLPAIYRKIAAQLSDIQINCLSEYFTNYQLVDLQREYNIHSMWKIPNINHLDQDQLFTLQELLLVRNELAIKYNRPIHWIISEKTLLKLVKNRNMSRHMLEKIVDVYPNFMPRNEFYDSLHTTLEKERPEEVLLAMPERGISKKRWITPRKTLRVESASPQMVSLFRDWVRVVSGKTELLPEFFNSKQNFPYIKRGGLEAKKIRFPGIPKHLHNKFINDLDHFIRTGKSTLSLEYIEDKQ